MDVLFLTSPFKRVTVEKQELANEYWQNCIPLNPGTYIIVLSVRLNIKREAENRSVIQSL